VRLTEAAPVTGGIILELLEIEDRALPSGGGAKRGKPNPRHPGKSRAKGAKAKRIMQRKRR
jgi:ribonuclease R